MKLNLNIYLRLILIIIVFNFFNCFIDNPSGKNNTTAPDAPVVSGTTPTNDTTPSWRWVSGLKPGDGTYRYKLDDSDLSSGATETTLLSFTPGSALSEAAHTLYVQESDDAGNWSVSDSFTITIDTTASVRIKIENIEQLNLNEISINISGNGIDPILKEIPVETGELTLDIPFAEQINFDATAATASVTFTGLVKKDITSYNVEVLITLQLSELKIVIPDTWKRRLVQIDDMADESPVVTNIGLGNNLCPYDVDFGPDGRIYIANGGFNSLNEPSVSDSEYRKVLVMDDIESTTLLSTSFPANGGISAIDIDRNNNLVYYACNGGNELIQADLEGNTIKHSGIGGDFDLAVYSVQHIIGLSAADNGYLYIVYKIDQGSDKWDNYLVIFDPDTGNVTEKQLLHSGTTQRVFDVTIQSPGIYISNHDPYDDDCSYGTNNIMKYVIGTALSEQTPDTFFQNPGDANDKLRGPHRFLEALDRRFYLIDENIYDDDVERLVAFDDFAGTNWQSFGETDFFQFFYSC